MTILGSVRKLDNLDDRREIVVQLNHLTEQQRIAYLRWAVDQAPINQKDPGQKPLKVVVSTKDARESPFPWGSAEQCYFDLMMAIQQHGVPVDIVLAELERRASKKLVACG